MPSIPPRILVVGGGPAGAVAAFWLGKSGFDVTVAERATTRFAYGQGIDITGSALEIIKRMGLEQEIRSNTTGEAGFSILDDDARIIATIPQAGEAKGAEEGWKSLSLTQEIEIMRGKLSKILADAAIALPNVEYRYGCTVSDLRQGEQDVTVVLSDTGKEETFSTVIGADGINSRVRSMGFDKDVNTACYKPIHQYGAFFSMPGTEQDLPNSRWQHSTNGRSILVRPVDKQGTRSSGYVIQTAASESLAKVVDGTRDEQKTALAEAFSDVPGIGPRVIEEMKNAEDFYFSRTAQIKLKQWHNGRVVLVGDAAYAPSPLTGAGTFLAILGSYILAGELAKSPDHPQHAFEQYHAFLKGLVTETQTIPLGGRAPNLFNPRTRWGIWIVRTLFWFVAWSGIWKYANIASDTKVELPKYDMSIS